MSIRQKYEDSISPMKRPTVSPHQKLNHPIDSHLPQTTIQKPTHSPYGTKRDSDAYTPHRIESRQQRPEGNDLEIRRLMNLVEMQQHEISSWKRKYDHLEMQANRLAQSQDTIHEYDQHIGQLNIELKHAMQMAEESQLKLREKEMQLQRVSKNEEQLSLQNKRLQEEISMLKSQLQQIEKDKQITLYNKDQIVSQQLDQIQSQHSNQIMIFNEQIQKLQSELLKRADEVELLADENQNLHIALGDAQRNIRNLHQQQETQKSQYQDSLEDKRREIQNLQQQKEQQLYALKQELKDEKLNHNQAMSSIEYNFQKAKEDLLLQKQEISQLQSQLRDLNEKIADTVQQNNIELEKTHQQNKKQIKQLQSHYQGQLEQLMDEVQKLNEILKDKINELDAESQANQMLKDYLRESEMNQNQLLEEMELWKLKFIELEHFSKDQIDKLQQENDDDTSQMEAQINRLEKLLQQKSQELDESRQVKNEISIKLNECNLHNQRLMVELECLRSKMMENQRQFEVQEEVREEIKRSQMDQMRRQLESGMDQLENENRNLRFMLDNKTKECDDWKQNYMKSKRL